MDSIDLHIISFDVPFPANYGGVIDVFYKLKALHKKGLRIALHCFDYGRGRSKELELYCSVIQYYDRSLSITNQFDSIPFIVKSRINEDLLLNLLKDEAPILFEGLHTCGILDNPRLKKRKKFVRMHNVEHAYYKGLAEVEKSLIKKAYYKLESQKLEKFEPIISKADTVLAISESDALYFQRYSDNSIYLPAFIENTEEIPSVNIQEFCLYHGNLEVVENLNAIIFLLEIFKQSSIRLIIAGRSPSKKVKAAIQLIPNAELIENPSNEKLNDLVSSARLNCLPTFQATGIKLKLIKALTIGNLVLANDAMLNGTELQAYCMIANSIEEWKEKIAEAFSQNVDILSIQERRIEVLKRFDNSANAKHLLELLA